MNKQQVKYKNYTIELSFHLMPDPGQYSYEIFHPTCEGSVSQDYGFDDQDKAFLEAKAWIDNR